MLCTFHNKCLTAHYIRPKFLLTLKNKKTDEKGASPTDIYIRYARYLYGQENYLIFLSNNHYV